jgi:1,2-phenylacetyl-CoA epoxidase PaaB subunit
MNTAAKKMADLLMENFSLREELERKCSKIKELQRNKEKANLFAELYSGSAHFQGFQTKSGNICQKKIKAMLKKFEVTYATHPDMMKVYTQEEREAEFEKFPTMDPFTLHAGDTVLVFVTRQDYLRKNNKNHGWVIVRANITDNGWEKTAIPWKVDLERWEQPIGKEVNKQDVDNCFYTPRYFYILAKIGTVTYLDLTKKGRKKNGKS